MVRAAKRPTARRLMFIDTSSALRRRKKFPHAMREPFGGGCVVAENPAIYWELPRNATRNNPDKPRGSIGLWACGSSVAALLFGGERPPSRDYHPRCSTPFRSTLGSISSCQLRGFGGGEGNEVGGGRVRLGRRARAWRRWTERCAPPPGVVIANLRLESVGRQRVEHERHPVAAGDALGHVSIMRLAYHDGVLIS